jgi:hypothetical protein
MLLPLPGILPLCPSSYKTLFFVAVLKQINCNVDSSVAGVWIFTFLFFNVRSISDQSFADAGTSSFTRVPIQITIALVAIRVQKNDDSSVA